MATVLYEARPDGVCLITLNRPQRHNALTMDMQHEYFKALRRAEGDTSVRVVVVTGAGRSFCVGADMDLLVATSRAGGRDEAVTDKTLEHAQLRLQSKPIVAAINGAAAGLGLVLALWCDVRFVASGAKLTFSFSHRGLVAEHGVSWILPRVVGASRALDLLLTSRVVLGTEAVGLGLANYSGSDAESTLDAAIAYAQGLAASASPASMCEIRRAVYADLSKGPEEASSEAISLMTASFSHPDAAEGVASYVERRGPNFQGLGAGTIRSRL